MAPVALRSFPTATISAIVAIIGIIFRTFVKKKPYSDIGDIMLGFAILMFGMQTMSGAVSPLKENPHFVSLLTMFKNPFMGILVGIAFTAVLQSASASVGILQALSITGSITFAAALPITMGNRCRSCLSCTAFFYRYEQERKAYSTDLSAE